MAGLALTLWDRLARLSADHSLTRMGRNSLPVFCAGSVLSMIGYVILVASGGGVVIETVLVAGGLMLLAGLAVALEDGIGALVPVAAAGQARSLVLHTAGWVRTLRAGR